MCTQQNMTGGNINNILQDNEASVVSGITGIDSINTDRGLSVDNKKRKTQWNILKCTVERRRWIWSYKIKASYTQPYI